MIDIVAEENMYVIDVASRISAADWDFAIGPTRHAFFNVRVAEAISVTSGGQVRDDRGKDWAAITGEGARWIDYAGPTGGGHIAGVTVIPEPKAEKEETWFVTDWGVVTVGPFRNRAARVRKESHNLAVSHSGA